MIVDRKFTKNMDTELAKFLDKAFTAYNRHRIGYKGNSEEEWEEHILKIRDGFRGYWLLYHEYQDDYWEIPEEEWEAAVKALEESCRLLGSSWPGFWR